MKSKIYFALQKQLKSVSSEDLQVNNSLIISNVLHRNTVNCKNVNDALWSKDSMGKNKNVPKEIAICNLSS